MRRASIKIAILVPILCILIAGVAATVFAVSRSASLSTREIIDQLMETKVNEFSNEFRATSIIGYSMIHAISPVIERAQRDSLAPRGEVVAVMKSVLAFEDSTVLGVWTAWEPNAFDGQDAYFVNYNDYHDDTGRFIPYVFRDGDTISATTLSDYDDPVLGIYYQGALRSGMPFITDPYLYEVAGNVMNVYSIAIPIIHDGVAVGVVGMDISLEDLNAVMNSGHILDDGYLVVLSPGGYIATYRNEDMHLADFRGTWLRSVVGHMETLLERGGQFSVSAYSEALGTDVRVMAKAVMIGDTGRYWAILGIIPESTIAAPSNDLTLLVVICGGLMIVVVGLAVYLLVNAKLRKLPVLMDMAKMIAEGSFNFNTISDDDRPTNNEIVLLERSFTKVTGVINGLITDLSVMGHAIDVDGDIDARVEADKFQGSYRSVAEEINKVISKLIGDTMAVLSDLESFGNGDFNSTLPQLPGKKAAVNQAIDRLCHNLRSVRGDIGILVSQALEGNLSNRADAAKYKGDWASLVGNLNELLETIAAPIDETLEVMRRISAGNFEYKVTGKYKGDFLAIKDSVNTTVTNVARYINEISAVLTAMANNDLAQAVTHEYVGSYASIKDALNNIIKTLNVTIKEIINATEHVEAGMESISMSSSDLANGASTQASSIEELNATFTVINESTKRNVENAESAKTLSDKSRDNAAKGGDDMQHMVEAMNDIKGSSAKITNVIRIIEDIAFQTNLLALNASVEAARAGEHGKGFAVVAEEVRTLAGRSQAAAKETTELIEESIKNVNEGTKIAEQTSDALRVIIDDVGKISGIIDNIALYSNEQASAMEQVADSLNQITEVVQSNVATSEESASASETLSNQSKIMKDLVDVFKLN